MKLAVIINSTDRVLIASRYKYITLLKKIYADDVQIHDERRFNRALLSRPDYAVVFGSFRTTYKLPLARKMKYILCDHDITSLYRPGEAFDERRKILGSSKIIFTSPDHQAYICNQYDYPVERTMVLYLRPSADDLNFEPLGKSPGKNLVYIGGLLDDTFQTHKQGRFSYRCYADIFTQIIKEGWAVHLYAARKSPEIYKKIGCTYHPRVPEGIELYRELSQYTAGMQGFANHNQAYEYAKTCRPNKIWNYLAGGIPTIGINSGNGAELFEGKWGYELRDVQKINNLDFSLLDLKHYREKEVIEIQAEELKRFIES